MNETNKIEDILVIAELMITYTDDGCDSGASEEIKMAIKKKVEFMMKSRIRYKYKLVEVLEKLQIIKNADA